MVRAPQTLASIDSAALPDLMQAYPQVWAQVGERLVQATKRGPKAMEAFVRQARAQAAPWRARVKKSHQNPQVLVQALPVLAAERMARLSMEQTLLAAASGQTGTIALGTWSGLIIQQLLFEGGLQRKPVSLKAFKFWWPLVTRKRALMPLVQQRGLYCFYTRELVAEVKALLGARRTVELAAGDGTLSRFLSAEGVAITASDDQSWSHAVCYPAEVQKADAVTVLTRERPQAVVCSFPPPGNRFEQRVFTTPSVERYVVVTSKHRFAAGDWDAYERQTDFEWHVDEGLSKLVLPPELDPAVLVFTRRHVP
jgi:hypothetical protein